MTQIWQEIDGWGNITLHKPYNVLKNKCYHLFRKLDKITIEE